LSSWQLAVGSGQLVPDSYWVGRKKRVLSVENPFFISGISVLFVGIENVRQI